MTMLFVSPADPRYNALAPVGLEMIYLSCGLSDDLSKPISTTTAI